MPALGTRKLRFFIGATEYTDSISTCKITADEKDTDFVSFAEAAAGGAREYKLALTLKQNTDSAALWYYMWNAAGTDVAITVWPNGGTVASTTTPKVTGTVTVTEPNGDLLGGDADASPTAYFTAEAEWTFTAKPALIVV